MKVIAPQTIGTAQFTSSTIAEPDAAAGEVAWNSGTAYTTGQEVVLTSTHRRYRALQNGTNQNPATQAAYWLDIGPTNRWAAFDATVGTASSKNGGFVFEVDAESINAVALLEVNAAALGVYIKDGSEVIYTHQADMTWDGNVNDWLAYFTEPIIRKRELVLTDLPSIPGGSLVVEVTDPGLAELGMVCIGAATRFGDTRFGARAGIIDYSRKETDAFGAISIVKRSFAKRASMSLCVPAPTTDYLLRYLADHRAEAMVFIGAENLYGALLLYGFVKDFEIEIATPTTNYCSLTIEGLT